METLVERAKTFSLIKKKRFLLGMKEAEFRDRVVRPLLLRQKFKSGRDVCGPTEQGKDAIFATTNSLGIDEIWVVQTKKGAINMSRKATENVAEAITQLRTALTTPVHIVGGGKVYPAKAILCASGSINQAARQHIVEEIKDSRVIFLDAELLIERIDEAFPELWMDIDANVTPYLRQLHRMMEEYSEDIIPAGSGTHSVPSSVSVDRFVMLHASRTTLVPRRRRGQVERVPRIDEVPVAALSARRERMILLTGEAGSGKSTSMRRIACQLIDRYLASPSNEQKVPVFVRASAIASSESTVLDRLASEVVRITGAESPAFSQDDLAAGRVVVLVDALDEVPSEAARLDVVNRLVDFYRTYPNCQVILSSRDYSSITTLPPLAAFERFRLTDISLGQASQLLGHLERARRLSPRQSQEILRRLKDIHGLALNPLLVTVFAITTDGASKKDIPANITELFKKYTELMLGRWDASKGLGQQYQTPLKDYLLKQIAYEMHRRRVTTIAVQEFRALVRQYLEKLGHELDVDVLVDELLGRSGLFRQTDSDVEFRHHLLQEFFAGRGVPGVEALEANISDEWWQRAVVFHFGESPDDARALKTLVQTVETRTLQERFRAAITIGLALQACYLVDISKRADVLAWVVGVLASSKTGFIAEQLDSGPPPLLSFVWYYLFGRDSVACSMPLAQRRELRKAVEEAAHDSNDLETRQFWLIVSAMEADQIEEAERLAKAFNPQDARLSLALYLGAFAVQHLRVVTDAERRLAVRISKHFEPKLVSLRRQLFDELKSELLEARNGTVHAIEVQSEGGQS